MTGYTAEQQTRLAELAREKADLDRRAIAVLERRKAVMRERGEPVREDYASRADYRAATSQYRRKRRA